MTEKKSRIVFLYYKMNIGGTERVLINLANGLSRKGMDITCVLLKKDGKFTELLSKDVNVVELGCTSQPLALLSPFSKAARFFKGFEPDVAVSFGHTINNLLSWLKIIHGLKFTQIATEHNMYGAQMKDDSLFHRKRRVLRARFLYRKAECCVCVSHGVADDLIGLGIIPKEKARVIYNPIYDESLHKLALQTSEYEAAFAHRPFILAVGRLVPVKGYDDLLRAFHILSRKRTENLRLVFVGDGVERRHLEKLASKLGISDKVHFAGWRINPYAWMANAECVVLTSYNEGLPSVLTEAMACGTNIVAADCPGGIREITENGRWGRMPEPKDIEGIASAIDDTLNDPLPGELLKKAAERFSAEHSVNEWHDLLSSIIKSG